MPACASVCSDFIAGADGLGTAERDEFLELRRQTPELIMYRVSLRPHMCEQHIAGIEFLYD